MNNGRRKAGLAVAVGLFALVILAAGITYPRPAEVVQELGYTNFTGLEVAAPTTYATETPAVVFDSAGLGNIMEVRDAQTPVWYIGDGGAVTSKQGDTFDGLLNANGGIAVDTSAFSVADTTGNTVVSGTLTVTSTSTLVGAVSVDSTLDVDGNISSGTGAVTVTDSMYVTDAVTLDINVENVMLPSVASQAFTYTASAGGTVALFTIGDGEIWIVHDVFINVTTNFDCTGDDCTVHVGDGGDEDGLCDLDDGELQAADVEVTGGAAGWQCFGSADTIGAYIASGRAHIYAPSGAAETIDAVLAAAGDDFSAGGATAYVVYTRVQ